MKLLPTLNIQRGRAVVLGSSEPTEKNPLELVAQLADRGCCRIALLDVDAAMGVGSNRALVAQLMRRFRQSNPKCCIQVGGGIRSSDQAQFFLDQGATWLLVGTVLYRFPMVVEQLLARFGEHLTATIDARQGEVQASGWSEPSGFKADEAARQMRDQGFRRILFTDIPKTGIETPDFATARRIVDHSKMAVYMASSLITRANLLLASEVQGLQGICLDAHLLLDHPDLLSDPIQPCA